MKEEVVQETLRALGVREQIFSVEQHHDDEDCALLEYLIQILQDDDAYRTPEDQTDLIQTIQAFLVAQEGRMQDNEEDAARLAQEIVSSLASKLDGGQQVEDPTSTVSLPRGVELSTTIPRRLDRERELADDKDFDPTIGTNDSKTSPKANSPKRESRRRKGAAHDTKKQPQQQRQQQEEDNDNNNNSNHHNELLEDEASAWKECQQQGVKWGGRGKGGRGEYAGAVNSIRSNIHLTNVTVSLPNGLELLHQSTMDIVKGHKYGLIGRNGVGKSTLLRRLSQKAIAGMPHDMKVLLVEQQMEGTHKSALHTLLEADTDRLLLLQEQEELEQQLEHSADELSTDDIERIGERLSNLVAELDAVAADTAEERAIEILKGLQFTNDMIQGPTSNLSGGWRMRLKLAQALFVPSDLLCLDEVTNHLDLYGLDWLIRYLQQHTDKTLMVVSHDRLFLDAVCTDIVVLEHHKLKYHVGNYSEYERQMHDKAARETQILDAAERQRTKAQAFVQKQQQQANKKNADPNKQRQAKMIKEKKMDRIGNYREDGKRYKLNSLKKLSEDYVRLAQKVVIEEDDPIIKMYFPNPLWPPGIGSNDALIRLEDFAFGFDSQSILFQNVTLSVNRGSKVALVGRNGCGKSTLMNLLASQLERQKYYSRGTLWEHPNIRIGHVTQYAVESLEPYAHQTVAEYAEQQLRSGKASADIVAKASGNVRQYLGAFGLGGRHALQTIGKLSGGERMRLCFATVLANQPHLLILDESTNHVDLETLDSMSKALNAFEGSILMVSHNQGFLSGFCNELWVLEQGRIVVHHSDTESFDELFSNYRASVILQRDSSSRANQRQTKADRAKRATQLRTGAKQNTALL